MAVHPSPVVVKFLSSALSIRVWQYPVSGEARIGNRKQISCLTDVEILILCHFPWNILLLPIVKPSTKNYHPVLDVREVKKRVEAINPTIPRPYIVFGLLDLKKECVHTSGHKIGLLLFVSGPYK